MFYKNFLIIFVLFFVGCANKSFVSYKEVKDYKQNGLEYLKNQDYTDASIEFNKALSVDLRDSSLQFLNALTYHISAELGDVSQYQYAEIGYKLALKFNPNNELAIRQLAFLYFKRKNYQLAQQFALKALFFNSQDTYMLYVLGASSYLLGDRELALNSFKEAYKWNQKNPLILRGLIIAYSSLGKFKEAEIYFNKYTKLAKNKRDIRFIENRINGWKRFFKLNTNINNIVVNKTNKQNQDNQDNLDYKMVNINVVIIGSHQQLNTNYGINLFDGLSLQFGKTFNSESAKQIDRITPENSTNTYSKTISTAISIPDITYSLNIFNNDRETYSIIAKPTLVALNGHQSEYFSGDSMHIGLISNGDSSPSEIVELPIGVKLIVTPKFLSKDLIQLDVEAQRTTIDETGTGGTFNSVVWTSKKHVHVNAVLKFGDTLLIGGLNEQEKESAVSKIPVLGDVPGVKYLFSSNGTMNWIRSDLILLTPKRVVINNYNNTNPNQTRDIKLSKFLINEIKVIYPKWKLKENIVTNSYLKREIRYNDMKSVKWYDKKDIENIINQLYL